jgi:2-polyprenyl-3-methyl-5-hydroxy-6-metoxy-1,4-benzoquinol methylase
MAIRSTGDQPSSVTDTIQELHMEYALSTNSRGEIAVKKIQEIYGDLENKRFLDIGSGYGGLVIAAAKKGAKCLGLEIDPKQFELSQLNIEDSKLKFIKVLNLDFLKEFSNSQKFDVITCDNVLEHIEYPQIAIQKIAQFLELDGMAYITVPNGRSFSQIRFDCHYGMPGMSLLSPAAGRAYFEQSKQSEDFSVTWMHRRGVYFEMANAAGLNLQIINGSRIHSELIVSELKREIEKTENVILNLKDKLRFPLNLAFEGAMDAIETCKSGLKIALGQRDIGGKSFLLAELEREFLESIWFMQATVKVPIYD